MGILRIHFTAEDLGRTRVASTSDPLWEVLLSRFRLHDPARSLVYQPWINEIRANPSRLAHIRTGARLLSTLAPLGPYFPDFLTPSQDYHGVDAGLDIVMSTPRRRLRLELTRLSTHTTLPDWIRLVADGDTAILGRLRAALRSYHQAAIAPHHDLIQASVDADRARRAHAVLAGGTNQLLTSLHPVLRWQPPILDVDYDVNQELHLHGRGLRLIPSYFCHGSAVSLANPDLTPVLIYPIDQDLRWPHTTTSTTPQSLQALLGTTRATVLHTVDIGATTTQLARHLNISPASASRHTTTLRNAGLITTHRHGTAVLHTLTPLGTRLLNHQTPSPHNGQHHSEIRHQT